MINDAREESNKRSIDNYGSAVINAILKNELTSKTLSGNYTTTDGQTLTNGSTTLLVDYDGQSVICDTIIVSQNGKVFLSQCSVGDTIVDYTYGEIPAICKAEDTSKRGNTSVGTKYLCDVDGTNKYTFFVLGKVGENVNLIMDSNIDPTGKPIKESEPVEKGLVIWSSSSAKGPTTALTI